MFSFIACLFKQLHTHNVLVDLVEKLLNNQVMEEEERINTTMEKYFLTS